ncbi:MAG: ABC transporter ATP-binding protein [Chloroflexi bacterium 13_1_40CM_4_65_16]|nr:MAG: ABC transporter ATP-binding protein [Chloroflexi bacterium 13_1_40CM_4_65_16]TMF83757.1 MAG: ABC transporter ATP-binding protein [Chloroflexota bacterium]TMG13339.1 MAG: ABC transporter ATP-binding protein [Chloroflexota bacterium]
MSLLQVDHLSKRFGGVVAVDDCTLSIPAGGITGLIGPNGSGKTTIFNLITGFIAMDEGRITFKSELIDGLGPDRVYERGIGRTFQLARIFPRLTALENLLVPVRRSGLRALFSGAGWSDERSKAMEMLEFLEISQVAGALGGSLSYGQRKLLELGAVMMAGPELVLLDEPAGGVNPALLERIADRLRTLNSRGTTFLIVEHNMSFVMNLCSEVIVVHRGRQIASGKPDAVRSDPAVLDAYLGA